jgi:hypothetical protein
MTSVVVAAASREGLGGSIWVRRSWVSALQQLGFDAFLLDGADTSDRERLESADLLVNLSGHLRDADLLRRPRVSAFVDLDPGYTQIWHAQGHDVGLAGHDHYFSVGANVGTSAWTLPTGDVTWHAIRQPVVLEDWPVADGGFSGFSTVGSWRGAFGPVEWDGRSYGPKAHQFRRFATLPETVGLPFEAALAIDAADVRDRELLESGGWQLRDPGEVATTDAFARYVADSGAEFSPAQDVYVSTSSGWFSDRTVRYLASGRPAVVQDTGLEGSLPVGDGLLTFRTVSEAADCVNDVVARYETHRRAARAIAEQFFSPEAALAPLLDVTGVTP